MEQLKKINPKEYKYSKMNFKEIEKFSKNEFKEENSNNFENKVSLKYF